LTRALANGRRLAIIGFLSKRREATVGEIAGAINLSFTSTSKHLRILSLADIVDKEQRRLEVYYRLRLTQSPVVAAVIRDL
jgi:DNA-binding transcriptional ArsR family regulator